MGLRSSSEYEGAVIPQTELNNTTLGGRKSKSPYFAGIFSTGRTAITQPNALGFLLLAHGRESCYAQQSSPSKYSC